MVERRRGSATILALFAVICLYCAPAVLALDGVASEGGTFRYGHVHWKSKGNAVEFTVEAAFKRAISDVSDWKGSAPDGLAQVGDTIGYPGRQPPQFYFGDGQLEHTLSMKVVAISVADDWVMGSLTLVHEYPTPNNNGEPWNAEFTGCCRYSYLVNNKDSEWAITAQIDLTLANKSPIASVLPIVSVPYYPAKDTHPTIYVPAYDDADKSVRFRVGKPWNVGNGTQLTCFTSTKVLILIPLELHSCCLPIRREKLHRSASIGAGGVRMYINDPRPGQQLCGVLQRRIYQYKSKNTDAFISTKLQILTHLAELRPGCLFRALRTDFGHRAMTAEVLSLLSLRAFLVQKHKY